MKVRASFERRLLGFALLMAAPGLGVALTLLFLAPWAWQLRVLAIALLAIATVLGARALRDHVVWPLRTVTNLLGALRDGDFSMRIRGSGQEDALDELVLEANALAGLLHEQRLAAQEATGLLGAVMAEIDVAILVFDDRERVRLANRAAERLLGQPLDSLLGTPAADLDLADCLRGETARTLERSFPGAAGRFAVRRAVVREDGAPHPLLVVANLSTALREEERSAWQRLIRVLGHELNSSLTPIKSISGSLARRVAQPELSAETREDLARGLAVIAERSNNLARFIEGYSRIARLPAPRCQPLTVDRWARLVAACERRVAVEVVGGPEAMIAGDPDQLQQLLLNLLTNAAEASLEKPDARPVEIGWRLEGGELLLTVSDDGPGLANPTNLFVPFFTTKTGGSGIGLVLCRQIAEAHGGSLQLRPRDGGGCVAELRLPA